jgi:tRNA (guanine37-N1)-methyltransferase
VKIWILTLFPEMFKGPLTESIMKRAVETNIVSFNLVNFRDYATDRHRTVDDTPYGGGAGMVLKPEPIFSAVDSISEANGRRPFTVLTTPQGEPFNQRIAEELSCEEELIFICGRYEGYDERIRSLADRELSLGDFVLTGGELASMVMIDATVRLIPGVLGDEASAQNDSFAEILLDYPQYTKPPVFRDMAVPDVLTSGHHAKISEWRRQQALIRTAIRRPDLLDEARLEPKEMDWLKRQGYLNSNEIDA